MQVALADWTQLQESVVSFLLKVNEILVDIEMLQLYIYLSISEYICTKEYKAHILYNTTIIYIFVKKDFLKAFRPKNSEVDKPYFSILQGVPWCIYAFVLRILNLVIQKVFKIKSLKDKYKTGPEHTRTSYKRGRIRSPGGANSLYWPVTSTVGFFVAVGKTEKIHTQFCPY